MKKILFMLLFFWGCYAVADDQGAIDDYIKNAPIIREHSQLNKIVKYIKNKYKKEEDIARSVLAWIVYNVDYDDYYYRQADKDLKSRRDLSDKIPEQGDIIKTRLGVCKDIAALYTEMLSMANVQSRVIRGCNAPPNDKKVCRANPHAWNVVWIEKKWELVDPTFAMGYDANALRDVSSQYSYKRAVKKREKRTSDTYKPRSDRNMNTNWFKVDPQRMAEDHQPDDKRWYLTKKSDRKKKD